MVTLAVVILVVAIAIVAWTANRKRSSTGPLELKLAVVGFETSGKTVFLGSMYHYCRVPDAGGVFLDTSPEDAGKLLDLYSTTADTDSDFPVSTGKGELTRWPFTVKVRSAAGVTDVARIAYLDFAGESLRDLFRAAPNPETQRLHGLFKSADVLMAALDGLQVKRYLENRPLPRFHVDLGTLLALLSDHHKAVNLLLTKWDILEDQYSFRQVVERLLLIDQFANFVRSQGIFGSCRLIPVSAVGPGFVIEAGDAMQKVPGKQINPARVEMPIACALPGALTAAEQHKLNTPGRSLLLAWAKAVSVGIGPVIIGVDPFRQEAVPSYLTTTQNTPSAVRQLVSYCDGKMARLDKDFPEADLVKFMTRQGM